MTIKVRRDGEIYGKDGGWFRAKWHFSFDEYYDPQMMGFGTLRVFNDDILVKGAVWPMHPHRNIEALTYVPEGTFRHLDSLGNDYTMPAGSVQRMTLGKGAYHSEANGSEDEEVRFIQIWIIPREERLEPDVEARETSEEERRNTLLRVIGPDRDRGSLVVHQDASMYVSRLEPGNNVEHHFAGGFGGYLLVMNGAASVNGQALGRRDAAMIWDERSIKLEATDQSADILMVEVRVTEQVV